MPPKIGSVFYPFSGAISRRQSVNQRAVRRGAAGRRAHHAAGRISGRGASVARLRQSACGEQREPVEMPVRYVIEMFCDRIAASKIYCGDEYDDSKPLEYFEKGQAKNRMHIRTGKQLEKLLKMLAAKGEKETFDYVKNEGIYIKTAEGILCVTKLQKQGKAAMNYKDFMNGARNFTGTVLQ